MLCKSKRSLGAKTAKTAQQVKALAAVAEDLSEFPAPTWQFTSVCNANSRGSNGLFWPPWALHVHYAQTYMQANA